MRSDGMLLNSWPRPLIIAHRGASRHAPESTRAAIRAALAARAHMIELDVQMSRDRRLVIFHDDTVSRTTDGTGRLSEMPYRTLSRLDAGRWFHRRFAGERILLASQALALITPHARVNLELKATIHPESLIRTIIRLIRSRHAASRVLLSSFEIPLVKRLRSSGLFRAVICSKDPRTALRQAIRLGCQAWHPSVKIVTRAHITEAHRAGLRVHVWTVDDLRTARRLMDWGVDGLFTNDPVRLRSLA